MIDMPLGQVGHRLGSTHLRRIFFLAGRSRDRVRGFSTGDSEDIGVADLTKLAPNLQRKKERPT
jgi:hypothetical protein